MAHLQEERIQGESREKKDAGSLLSREEVEKLQSFDEGGSGYFYQMLDYLLEIIQTGIEKGRFTEEQAYEDLEIGLWYAYACLNIDTYECYYRAARWLADSEKHAGGCGTWYYRYSVALTYCGRLEEAFRYAEQGTKEEPDYPWIWLQAGKLRSHFQHREGALKAVEQGLSLVPDDYEFQTLREEILKGASLEEMEYHWIDPSFDSKLQAGLDENADSKLQAISCIAVDPAGLAAFREIFHLEELEREDSPYCSFHYPVRGREVELIFRMNKAGLSKLKPEWLKQQKERLDGGGWLVQSAQGKPGVLETVFFGLDLSVNLIYRLTGEDGYFQMWLNEDGEPVGTGAISYENGEEDGQETMAECYEPEEMDAVQKHIETYFGEFESIWHELVSPDIHVDICLIPPAWDRDHYTLVTMGMGAHRMAVPEELADQKLERAELAIALPSDWKLDETSLQDENWYWPLRLLKVLARLPKNTGSWLGWGHTIENGEAFAFNTELCGALLVRPQDVREGGEACILPDGSIVNFYQVIPLYQDEMEYKQAYGAEELLEKMKDISFVVHPARPDALAETEDITSRPAGLPWGN